MQRAPTKILLCQILQRKNIPYLIDCHSNNGSTSHKVKKRDKEKKIKKRGIDEHCVFSGEYKRH